MDRVLQLESCQVDLDRRLVLRDEGITRLTEQETALLEYLAARPGQPVHRDELLREVWGFTGRNLITRAVDVAVRRLRTKVERQPSEPAHLITVRHVGYRFEPDPLVLPGAPMTPGPPPPRRSTPPPRAPTLPPEHTRFVGREADLAALQGAVSAGRGLVTVVGPPGVGKTRLAVRLAHELRQAGRAVAFVDLSPARGAADLVQRVGDTLTIPLVPEASLGERIEQLGRALADRGDLVLVLDNVEQLVDEARHLGRWLEASEELVLVVTSRERLRLPGEQVVALDPLGTDEAVHLFLDRAHALARDWGADEAEMVERIVEDLDGLPLAIELAAARAPVLPPKALLDGLQQRFRLLADGARRGDARTTTLRGALDWSWSLLQPFEQHALAQLSVFEASFAVADAEAVVDLGDFPDAPWVLDWLQGLVDRSLVRAVRDRQGARFELLQSQRAFAADQLHRLGVQDATRQRHRDHVLGAGEAAVEGLHGARGPAALSALRLLADDVRAVLRRASPDDPEGVIRAARILEALLEITGPLDERLAALQAALKVASDPADRAALLLARARVRSVQAEQELAIADTDQAAALAEDVGDRGLAARAVGHKAWLLEQRSAYAEARIEAERSLTMAREVGDRLAEAWAHNRLGQLVALDDDLPAAEAHFRAMRAIADELGSWRLAIRARSTLGFVARSANRFSEAEKEYRAALEVAREAGDVVREATVLGNLGALASAQGQLDDAVELFAASLERHRATGNRRLETMALGNYGILLMGVGRLREARARLVEATALADRRDNPRHRGMMEGNLGVSQVQLGELDEARAHLERSVELLRKWGTPFTHAYFSVHLGIVLADLDEPAAAEKALADGERELGDHPVAAGMKTVAVAHLHLSRGREARREGRSVLPHQEAFEQALEQAEKIATDARDVALANALNAVLPSELFAALRNLRRTAVDRRL